MGARYKRNGKKPTLEYLTTEGVIRWAEALKVPYWKYDYWLWWSFAELADLFEGAKRKRLKAKEERERIVGEWMAVKDK
ncbi:MAG: hypothetical protein LBC59_09365 [Chitinispirillales bacterium]|jgi:hypothetical protein|nr:hypothetical protein [Chitinispirillales bacterium]